MKYKVLWIDIWKTLTQSLSIALITFVFVLLFIEVVKDGNFSHTLSIEQLALLIFGIVVFSAIGSFIVALFIKFAAVEIQGQELVGRNYWGFKKRLPISAITSLTPFSQNGIDVIIASADSHGEVYISTSTENLDELLDCLEKYMQGNYV